VTTVKKIIVQTWLANLQSLAATLNVVTDSSQTTKLVSHLTSLLKISDHFILSIIFHWWRNEGMFFR
jgi:hypothetical protein